MKCVCGCETAPNARKCPACGADLPNSEAQIPAQVVKIVGLLFGLFLAGKFFHWW